MNEYFESLEELQCYMNDGIKMMFSDWFSGSGSQPFAVQSVDKSKTETFSLWRCISKSSIKVNVDLNDFGF